MAWNDPGNSPGKRNPWEKRTGKSSSNGTGADELIKQFKKLFSPLSGSGSSNHTARNIGGVLMLIVLGIFWVSTGIYQVNAGQVAVITRFGKFVRVDQPGHNVRLPWPIEDAQLVNITDDQHSDQMRVLTHDEAMVDVVFAVKFRRADAIAWVFNVSDPDATLVALSQSAVREVFGHETMSIAVGATRQVLAAHARDLAQDALDNYKAGIVISSLDIVDVRVPSEVKSAQEEVSKAQNDAATVTTQAREYASDVIPKANGAAAAAREDAEGYKSQRIALATGDTERFLKLLPEYQKAPAAVRERLYIETMESIYSTTRKIFVDAKGTTVNVGSERATSLVREVVEPKPAATNPANSAAPAKVSR